MTGKNTQELIQDIRNGACDAALKEAYIDENLIEMQKERYIRAISKFAELFGDRAVMIFSAPGRSEVGGNHTDHQHGKVLATSVNIDTIAVAAPSEDGYAHMQSEGYDRIDIDLKDLSVREEEYGTTTALIRGVAAGMKERGCRTGGFMAYATSQVLSGSGLSSSASFEVLLGNIFSGLYNERKADPVMLAQIGQMAENRYFGKPCGLEDQMACSVGGLIHIDFADPAAPVVTKVSVDFEAHAHSLCILDTKGSHADLTDDYAGIPKEMKAVSAFFGKEVLREVDEDVFYEQLPAVRRVAGDRAVLRAIHFFDEEKRVDKERDALLAGDFEAFKQTVLSSGQSSYKYLQNVYAAHKTEEQSAALALTLTAKILGDRGAWRIHGGGFAGTIQAFVPNDLVEEYKRRIERIFGEGACHVLKVRGIGGTRIM